MAKDFSGLTLAEQIKVIEKREKPLVFGCAGVAVYRNPDGLKTEIAVGFNTTRANVRPYYYSGYADITDESVEDTAFRKLKKESGCRLKRVGTARLLGVFGPRIRVGKVEIGADTGCVEYLEGDELATPGPISLTVFAVDHRELEMVYEAKQEVLEYRWMSLENVIRGYGRSNELHYKVVLAALTELLRRETYHKVKEYELAFEPWLSMPKEASIPFRYEVAEWY